MKKLHRLHGQIKRRKIVVPKRRVHYEGGLSCPNINITLNIDCGKNINNEPDDCKKETVITQPQQNKENIQTQTTEPSWWQKIGKYLIFGSLLIVGAIIGGIVYLKY